METLPAKAATSAGKGVESTWYGAGVGGWVDRPEVLILDSPGAS